MKPIMVFETGQIADLPFFNQGEWTVNDGIEIGEHLNEFSRSALYRNEKIGLGIFRYSFIYQDRMPVSGEEFFRPAYSTIKESGKEKIINRCRKRSSFMRVLNLCKVKKLSYKLKTYAHLLDYFDDKTLEGDILTLLFAAESFNKCKFTRTGTSFRKQ